ncbi:MAG: class I SAM-dependent methyltransferase, partial [Acidobacteria bacterium]|nr:class I SAM-dependent methyltransferase [Acidobacteriota bacterium]
MKLLPALLALSAAAWPQTKGVANAHYQTAEQRQSLARSLSDTARDERQKPRELVRSLNIRPGSRVVDLGAGPGYMESHFSAAVGPQGKVIAEDVQQDFLDAARQQAARLHLGNVE